MKKYSIVIALIAFGVLRSHCSLAQQKPPKLAVGIVVDQMRYDFIYRFWDQFSEDGFKKLVQQGYFCKNTKYDYSPTYTGPGHASIYTGSHPAVHGICANSWFDRKIHKSVNCVHDNNHQSVGEKGTRSASPHRLLSSTIGDELKLSTQSKSKVISISIKDRGAILSAGHAANGVFWFSGKTGHWISSTYYMDQLPQWVSNFNNNKRVDEYLSQTWSPQLSVDDYGDGVRDDNPHEVSFMKDLPPTFPYDLKQLKEKYGYHIIKTTPWGNTLTTDLALAAFEAESMGADEVADLLMISYSSTDYVGHRFGPHSLELADTYIRLDLEIARLLSVLESKLGKDNFLVFLTADHGAVNAPSYLQEQKIPADYWSSKKIKDTLNSYLNKQLGGADLVEAYMNNQIYLSQEQMNRHHLKKEAVEWEACLFLTTLPEVVKAYTSKDMLTNNYTKGVASFIQNGFYPQRSGDVFVVTAPGWIGEDPSISTTHGTAYNYDIHVPLLWYGWNVQPGSTVKPVNITDIAPTLSVILNASFPNSTTGNPLKPLLDPKH